MKKNIFSARLNNQSGVLASPPNITEFAVLYGICNKSRFWFCSAGGGLAYISGEDRNHENVSAIGIPIEGQLFATPLPFIGVGLYGLGNLNLRVPFFGIMLCLQLGKLR
jgi:hypothetical protein